MICFLYGLQRTKAECEICGYFANAQYDNMGFHFVLTHFAQNDKGLFVILTSLLSY